jgi:SAM-dependent methyltransferase
MKKISFERCVCLKSFYQFIVNCDLDLSKIKIGYIGNKSQPDFEIQVLKALGANAKNIYSLGIGHDVDFLIDLDLEQWSYKKSFDILIVSNVFEHLWNLDNALSNIVSMVNTGSYIYIIGPTYNFYHESPRFYSSGFDYNYFKNNLELKNCKTIVAMRIGSKRLYSMQHLLRSWPTSRGHSFPLLFAFDEVKFPYRGYLYIKNFISIFLSSFKSAQMIESPHFCTGMLIILKRL